MSLSKGLFDRAPACSSYGNMEKSCLIVAVAFVDFRKALESVLHRVLLEKLSTNFGICDQTLGWIASYLNGRMQYTAVNGYNSDTMPVSVGIPQASVLGPTLFSLFVNDLPSSVKSGSVYLFADDVTIYCIKKKRQTKRLLSWTKL